MSGSIASVLSVVSGHLSPPSRHTRINGARLMVPASTPISIPSSRTATDYDLSSVSFRPPAISDIPEVVCFSLYRSQHYNPGGQGKDFFFAPLSGPIITRLGTSIESASKEALVSVLPEAMRTATDVILNGNGWNLAAVDANGMLIGIVRIKEFDHKPWSLHETSPSPSAMNGKSYIVHKPNGEDIPPTEKKAIPTFEISYFLAPPLMNQSRHASDGVARARGFTGVGSGIVARAVNIHANDLQNKNSQRNLKLACYMATVASYNPRSRSLLSGLKMSLAAQGDIDTNYVDPYGQPDSRLVFAAPFETILQRSFERLSDPRFRIYANGSVNLS